MPSLVSNSIRKSVKVIARIKRTFEDLEKAFVKSAGSALSKSNDEFLKRARQIVEKGDLNQVSSLTLDLKEYQTILFSLIVEARRAGRVTGITEGLELKQFYERKKLERKFLDQGLTQGIVNDLADQVTHALNPQNKQIATSFSVVPYDALNFYGDYSLYLKGVAEQELLNKAKQKIYSGIQNGLSVQNIMGSLESVFPSFHVGRLQNIARTETSRAMNEGRIEGFQSPALKGFITAVEFSAILDSRTSDICEDRDGLILAIDDPRLKSNTPPLHYQCRSILVPVDKYSMVEEGLDEKVGKGWNNIKEPMEGFGGVIREVKENFIPSVSSLESLEGIPPKKIGMTKEEERIYQKQGENYSNKINSEMKQNFSQYDWQVEYPKTPEDYNTLSGLQKNINKDVLGFYDHINKIIAYHPNIVLIAGDMSEDKFNTIIAKTAIRHEPWHAVGDGFIGWPETIRNRSFLEEAVTDILSKSDMITKENITPDDLINDITSEFIHNRKAAILVMGLLKKYNDNSRGKVSGQLFSITTRQELEWIKTSSSDEQKEKWRDSFSLIDNHRYYLPLLSNFDIITKEEEICMKNNRESDKEDLNKDIIEKRVVLWFLKKLQKL